MTRLHAEVAVSQLSKVGEELCGDRIEVTRTDDATIIVLSDGLGSGVKANILATLTTKIASSLLRRGISLEEAVSTIAQTLPVCRVRKIAYSTLHIIAIDSEGETTVVEFDSPPTYLVRAGKVVPFPTRERVVVGKTIREGRLSLQEGDVIAAVSDGVIHAGIGGGLLKLGWNWHGVATQLEEACQERGDAYSLACRLIGCCEGYYLGKPGDDSSVVTVRLRPPRRLTLLTGPPKDPGQDEQVVGRFLAAGGKKIVAGGTTANIVSRVTGKPLVVDLASYESDLPPIAKIEGIDLVTEGVLTLTAAADRLDDVRMLRDKRSVADGATRLARLLAESDTIDIYAGSAVNPAHQNPNFPSQINIKGQVLAKLRDKLEGRGKKVTIEWV